MYERIPKYPAINMPLRNAHVGITRTHRNILALLEFNSEVDSKIPL